MNYFEHSHSNPKTEILCFISLPDEAPSKLAFLDLIMENSNFTFEELMSEVNIFIIAVSMTFRMLSNREIRKFMNSYNI